MKKRTKAAPSVGPSQAVVDACVKLVAQVGERVAPGEKPMTSKERQRTLKLKRGGRGTARVLAALAVKNGLGGLVPVEEMLKDVEHSERLQALAHDAANLSALLGDLILQADGKAWKVAVKAYTVLKRMAADDPTLMAQLAPVVDTFANRRTRTKKAPASADVSRTS